jgi:hypothetical protein
MELLTDSGPAIIGILSVGMVVALLLERPMGGEGQNNWWCSAYRSADGCSGGLPWERDNLRTACNQHDFCYYGPIKNSFSDTCRHCSNLFKDEAHRISNWFYHGIAIILHSGMAMDPVWNNGAVMGPGYGDSFQNRQIASDWECNMGKSKPAGYNLARCRGSGSCSAGTSCYNCCTGDSGFQCNRPWWE